jgi:hypothetical protein
VLFCPNLRNSQDRFLPARCCAQPDAVLILRSHMSENANLPVPDDPGVCYKRTYGDDSVLGSFTHGIIMLICCAVLVAWARAQYSLQATGYLTGTVSIIFPVHLRILILLAFSLLSFGLVLTVFSAEEDSTGLVYIVLYASTFGLCVGIQGRCTLLILLF